MFLVSLFRAYSILIYENNKQIIQLSKFLTYNKYFSNSYVICTSNNYYLDYKSRKRRYIETIKGEVICTPDFKICNNINLLIYSSFLENPEVNFESSLKNSSLEQDSIENKINDFYNKIIKYFENGDRVHNCTILLYFKEIMRNYELLNSKKIYEKKIIVKVEEILKKIIQKSFSLNNYKNEKFSILLKKIYESYSKDLNNIIECNKLRSLYEILLDINFKDDISKDKKDMIINFKYYLLKTKDYDEMEKNIKKIYKDNKKYYKKTFFINFLSCFFDKEEYFILKLLKGSYKSGKYPHKLFLKDNIPKIIESYDDDKCSLVLNNISDSCLIEISEKF